MMDGSEVWLRAYVDDEEVIGFIDVRIVCEQLQGAYTHHLGRIQPVWEGQEKLSTGRVTEKSRRRTYPSDAQELHFTI